MTSLRRYYSNIASLARSHPARQLLDELSLCEQECLGREITWKGCERKAINQEWVSPSEGHRWSFSHFAYKYVPHCPERILDAWIDAPQEPSEHEVTMIKELPLARSLLSECAEAASHDNNQEILKCVKLTQSLLNAVEKAIVARWEKIGFTLS